MLKHLLFLISVFIFTVPLVAQDDFTTWFNMEVRKYHYYDLQAGLSPSASTDGGGDLDWKQFKAAGLYTLHHNEVVDIALWGSYQDVTMESSARLTNATPVPDHMSNARIGLSRKSGLLACR